MCVQQSFCWSLVWVWARRVSEWRVSLYRNVYSLDVHVPCACEWQSSLYFAEVYSCREAMWPIVKYTCNLSRFFLLRSARFFMWPWLVILWREPVYDCSCSRVRIKRHPICFCSSGSGWLRSEPLNPGKKRICCFHCGSTERGLFIHLFIFNSICLIFQSCEMIFRMPRDDIWRLLQINIHYKLHLWRYCKQMME